MLEFVSSRCKFYWLCFPFSIIDSSLSAFFLCEGFCGQKASVAIVMFRGCVDAAQRDVDATKDAAKEKG